MSERIPTAEDIRLALIEVGYTHYEADDAIEAVKRRTAHDRAVTLLDTKKTHERAIAELRHDLKVALAEVANLREENDRLERILQAPLSLKDLEAAWEAAEEADECRKGDVLILKDWDGGFQVYAAMVDGDLTRSRILSRAPREPWVELAGVLHDVINQGGDDRIDVDSAAARLYAEGVRLTGGDES